MSGQGGLIKTHRRCQSVATPCSGFATLVIALILLMVATIAVLTVARAGVFEQRYAGIDIRSKEVHAAAAGGLEFGIQWFEANWAELVWPSGAAGEVAVSPSPAAELPVTEAGADSYRLDVGYELLTALDAAPGA